MKTRKHKVTTVNIVLTMCKLMSAWEPVGQESFKIVFVTESGGHLELLKNRKTIEKAQKQASGEEVEKPTATNN